MDPRLLSSCHWRHPGGCWRAWFADRFLCAGSAPAALSENDRSGPRDFFANLTPWPPPLLGVAGAPPWQEGQGGCLLCKPKPCCWLGVPTVVRVLSSHC